MAKNINVCSDWHGTSQETFNFINQNTTPAAVTSVPTSTWPFAQPSPINVPGKGVGGPGSVEVSLLPLANGTYYYDVTGCITGGQPKNVTIP